MLLRVRVLWGTNRRKLPRTPRGRHVVWLNMAHAACALGSVLNVQDELWGGRAPAAEALKDSSAWIKSDCWCADPRSSCDTRHAARDARGKGRDGRKT